MNFNEYILYRHYDKQEVNEVLSTAEKRLSDCRKQSNCDYSRTFESVDYLIPKEIHRYHINKLEVQALEKHGRTLDPETFVNPSGELIAYPSKSEFSKESFVYKIAIDPSSDHSIPSLEFDPPIMNLGLKYIFCL